MPFRKTYMETFRVKFEFKNVLLKLKRKNTIYNFFVLKIQNGHEIVSKICSSLNLMISVEALILQKTSQFLFA